MMINDDDDEHNDDDGNNNNDDERVIEIMSKNKLRKDSSYWRN